MQSLTQSDQFLEAKSQFHVSTTGKYLLLAGV